MKLFSCKLFLCLLILGLSSISYAQVVWSDATIVKSKQLVLKSQYTHQSYLIQVSAVGDVPKSGYPILYLLDGNAFFPMASAYAQGLNLRADENHASSVLIVGIGYPTQALINIPARSVDYTPTPNDLVDTKYQYGGAEQFHHFVEYELKPLIEKEWKINSRIQGVFGHSYGGLYTMYNLLHSPDNYSHYFIASPSIWWNNQRIKQFYQDFKLSSHHTNVYLSVGEYEQFIPPYLQKNREQRQQHLNQRAMIDSLNDFYQYLQDMQSDNLVVNRHIYPQATHIQNGFMSLQFAIMKIFEDCLEQKMC